MKALPTLALYPFLWPPRITAETLRLVACAAAGCLALLIAFLMLRLIWRIRWKSQTTTHYLHLRNRGNLQSVIDLGAYSPDRKLKFRYVLDGAVLPERKTIAPPAAPAKRTLEKPAEAPHAPDGPIPAAAQAPAQPPAKSAASSVGEAIASAQEKAAKVSGIAALLVDILSTLGSILPGALGESLKQKSTQLQAQKAAIKAKGQAPAREIKQVQHLQSSVGELKEEIGPANPPATAPVAVPARKDGAQPTPPADAVPGYAAQPGQALTTGEMPCPAYVQLPPLAPAATACLALRVTPANPYFRGDSFVWVYTRPQGSPGLPPGETSQPQKTVQPVSFAGMPLFFWLLSILLSLVALAFNGAWLTIFVRWVFTTFA